ncbi:MAG: transposase [Actinobacteria bacterium]|nr:transposase [Actinomycetota bacterium]
MEPFAPLDALHTFRDSLYRCFDRRVDVLFEMGDALLTAAQVVPSPVHLSLEPAHRRGWASLYAALDRGRIDAEALRKLLVRYPLAAAVGDETPVYAVDVSVWPRCDAESSPQRGYYYHPSRHSAGQPIVAGWAYQFIARIGFARESWTAPMDVKRVHPTRNANAVAAEQVKALLLRSPPEEAIPLFVFDAGYDPVQLQQGLEGSRWCQILVRLRAGRCFYADPSGPPAPTGRSRRHGRKFECKDPATWPEPSAEYVCEDDAGYGKVHVRAWANLHPKVQAHAGRGSRGPTPIVRGTLVLVEVERLPRGERRREPRVLWLWWHGGPEGAAPELDLLWRAYARRFDVEHTFRFLKQTLGWTTPRLRHPEQADRWTWLVLAAYTQLRLARACVADRRLPWERRYAPGQLTPCRVHRAVSALLVELGTPAKPPKPCGRSPGRPKGRRSGRAKRYPALKKAA